MHHPKMFADRNSSAVQFGFSILNVAGTARPRFFLPFGTVYWMH
jgi:hypothetical protein